MTYAHRLVSYDIPFAAPDCNFCLIISEGVSQMAPMVSPTHAHPTNTGILVLNDSFKLGLFAKILDLSVSYVPNTSMPVSKHAYQQNLYTN